MARGSATPVATPAAVAAGSQQSDGRMIALLSASYTTLHKPTNAPGMIDIVSIFGASIDTVPRTVTLAWGDQTTPNLIKLTIYPNSGLVPIVQCGRIRGSLSIDAKADADNVVNCQVRVDTVAQAGV